MSSSHPTHVRASAVIVERAWYPRVDVDPGHVANLARALRAGATLPPIVVDAEQQVVLDGVHRLHAYVQVYGPEALVPVEWRACASDAERLAIAIQANARHGLPLRGQDRVRCVLLAERYGIGEQEIARWLAIEPMLVRAYRARHVVVEDVPLPARRTVPHLWGRALTVAQYEAMRRGPGVPVAQLARQLTDLIEHDLVDWHDARVLKALRRLATVLDRAIAARA